jgi:flavin-dependent dehydrogenase
MGNARRIAIVGAGLGGLAAAIALRRQGFEVQVYEQAAELAEFGAGINGTDPYGITAGPDGNVWFTEFDFTGNRIDDNTCLLSRSRN